jgi:hypothetical protein
LVENGIVLVVFAKKYLQEQTCKYFLLFAAFLLRKSEESGVKYLEAELEEEVVNERHNDYHRG